MQATVRLISLSILAFGLSIVGLHFISCSEKADNGPKQFTAVTIVKGNETLYPQNVQLIMSAPMPDEVLKSDSVKLELRVDNFEIGMPSEHEQSQGLAYYPDGQHVCSVIDDTMQVIMTSGVATIGPLTKGRHTLQAFARYSWYESLKAAKAFASYAFYIRSRGADTNKVRKPVASKKSSDTIIEMAMPVKEVVPMLVYNSPSVDVSGNDAERVLLDFYLANVELAQGKYRVLAIVDAGKPDTLLKWCPYYIEGLKPGKHTVRIDVNSLPIEYLPLVKVSNSVEVTEGTTYVYHIPLKKK